ARKEKEGIAFAIPGLAGRSQALRRRKRTMASAAPRMEGMPKVIAPRDSIHGRQLHKICSIFAPRMCISCNQVHTRFWQALEIALGGQNSSVKLFPMNQLRHFFAVL